MFTMISTNNKLVFHLVETSFSFKDDILGVARLKQSLL